MIKFETPKHHWNYFLAIEEDLRNISRFIEFSEENLNTYSIELAHILLSASSEIDVILKQLCHLLEPAIKVDNIDKYRAIVKEKLPLLINEEIKINRFWLVFKPWENWNNEEINPDWWKSYNKVKHERNIHFNNANLRNVINAVWALLIVIIYYYKLSFQEEQNSEMNFKDVTRELLSESKFVEMNSDYYHGYLII
jgi:hypothetical protein